MTCPPEIRLEILKMCPDMKTLLSAASSGHVLHEVFQMSSTRLIESHVHDVIPPQLLAESVRMLNAMEMCQDRMAIRPMTPVIQALLAQELTVTRPIWSGRRGKTAIKIHQSVAYLANIIGQQFVNRWNDVYDVIGARLQPLPSSTETDRIMAALYRFETFCVLFAGERVSLSPDHEEAKHLFLCSYKPWEVEQMAAVYEAVCRLVRPASNEIVLHDIELGSLHIPYADSSSCSHLEEVVGKGLTLAHQIYDASSYDERHKLIAHLFSNGSSFWTWSLHHYNEEIRNASLEGFVYPPIPADVSDRGVKFMWERANDGQDNAYQAGMLMNENVRAIGYVFYDYARVEASQALVMRWMLVWNSASTLRLYDYMCYYRQKRSFEERERLFVDGHEGY